MQVDPRVVQREAGDTGDRALDDREQPQGQEGGDEQFEIVFTVALVFSHTSARAHSQPVHWLDGPSGLRSGCPVDRSPVWAIDPAREAAPGPRLIETIEGLLFCVGYLHPGARTAYLIHTRDRGEVGARQSPTGGSCPTTTSDTSGARWSGSRRGIPGTSGRIRPPGSGSPTFRRTRRATTSRSIGSTRSCGPERPARAGDPDLATAPLRPRRPAPSDARSLRTCATRPPQPGVLRRRSPRLRRRERRASPRVIDGLAGEGSRACRRSTCARWRADTSVRFGLDADTVADLDRGAGTTGSSAPCVPASDAHRRGDPRSLRRSPVYPLGRAVGARVVDAGESPPRRPSTASPTCAGSRGFGSARGGRVVRGPLCGAAEEGERIETGISRRSAEASAAWWSIPASFRTADRSASPAREACGPRRRRRLPLPDLPGTRYSTSDATRPLRPRRCREAGLVDAEGTLATCRVSSGTSRPRCSCPPAWPGCAA